jgi:hypothetical protein
MKAILRVILVTMLFVLCILPLGGAQSAPNDNSINPSAFIPWKAQNTNETQSPDYISVGWGSTQSLPQKDYPLVSYTYHDDTDHIRFMRPAVDYVGDCGPDTAWNCSILDTEAVPGTISQMQTYAFQNSFKAAWVYKDRLADENHLYTVELTQGLMNAGESDVIVMDLDKFDKPGFDYTQYGPASIAFDDYGNLHMVVVLQFGGVRLLVYAHKISTAPSTPCNFEPNTPYQCDIIYQNSTGIFDTPKLVLTADNKPRISWLNFNPAELMYAYPLNDPLLFPNCGPGGDTWRCITIKHYTPDLNFAPDGKMPRMDMAIGPGSPQMVIEAWDSLGRAQFMLAKYVGGGGNCGEDYILIGISPPTLLLLNRWECVWDVWDTNAGIPAYDEFALKVDSFDYPILALNRSVDGSHKIGVLYNTERRGLPPGNWYFDLADWNLHTGRGVSMAIGTNDRLLLGYAKQVILEDDLKIAIQDVYKNFVPTIRK